MLQPSYLMLPPSVSKLVKLGPEKISGERIIYRICQETDCCLRSVNCLIYTARHVVTKPVCFLEQIYFFIVQSPSACFNIVAHRMLPPHIQNTNLFYSFTLICKS